MTAAHYKGGHHPGNDLGLHYTALPPIVASCPYSDQLLVTRKFWSPGANRSSQVSAGLWLPAWHYVAEFIRAVLYERLLHMLNPDIEALLSVEYAFHYGIPIALVALGFW